MTLNYFQGLHKTDNKQDVLIEREKWNIKEISQPSLSLQFAYSKDGIDDNLLLVLQGKGGDEDSFFTFAKSLQLPRTAVAAIRLVLLHAILTF